MMQSAQFPASRCSFTWLPKVAAAMSLATVSLGCDLCAIYRAADARGEFTPGSVWNVSEQFTHFGTEQFNGVEFIRPNPDLLDRSITHVVGGWNFSERFGVSLNLPVVHQSYRFTRMTGGFTPTPREGSETGIGDLTLVGRWRVVGVSSMDHGFTVNLLGGIHVPTGDTAHLEELREDIDHYESVVGPGHSHDALGPVVGGVHLHDLSLGSGAVDGLFGIAASARWNRYFWNTQAQYVARTEGAGHYRFADELILSGGPGGFLWLNNKGTLSLALNTAYETRGSDEFRGRPSIHTGQTVWFLGPLLTFTWKSHFSAQVGGEAALRAAGRGFQNVPDYRINAALSWRF